MCQGGFLPLLYLGPTFRPVDCLSDCISYFTSDFMLQFIVLSHKFLNNARPFIFFYLQVRIFMELAIVVLAFSFKLLKNTPTRSGLLHLTGVPLHVILFCFT